MINRNILDHLAEAALPIKHLEVSVLETLEAHAPDHVSGLSESRLRIQDLEGRVIVFLVFGVSCGTCKHLAGVLSDLSLEYSDVKVVGICVQTGCSEQLQDFARNIKVRFPLGYCTTRELCPALGIPASMWLFYPTLIFVDQQQRLRAVFPGKHDFFQDPTTNIRAALDQMLGEASRQVQQAEVTA
jgi:hypothetical protein